MSGLYQSLMEAITFRTLHSIQPMTMSHLVTKSENMRSNQVQKVTFLLSIYCP